MSFLFSFVEQGYRSRFNEQRERRRQRNRRISSEMDDLLNAVAHHQAFVQAFYVNQINRYFNGKPQPWLLDRIAKGDFQSVHVFVNQDVTPRERLTMIHRVINDPSIVESNHTFFDDE